MAFGCAATLLVLALAWLARGLWVEPLAVRALRAWARAELGAEIEVERVSGGFLGDVTLEGLRWSGARPPLVALAEARVELRYSLPELLRGARELDVRVEGRGIEIELGAARPGERARTLPELPALELELTDVVVRRAGEEPVHIQRLRAQGGLHAQRARVDELELEAGANRVALAHGALDLSSGDWLEIARSLQGELRLALPDASVLERVAGRALGLRAAELELSADRGRASVSGRIELAGGTLAIERGELALPAGAALEELELDLELRAQLAELTALAELFGWEVAGRWSGTIDVAGHLGAPTGRFLGRGEALQIAGIALDSMELDVWVDGQNARIERCEAFGPDFEAVVRGELRLEPLELSGVALDLTARRAALAHVLPVPCESFFLHARLSGPLRSPSGPIEASATGIQLGRFTIDDAEARGEIAAERLDVAELRLTVEETSVEARGALQRSGDGFEAEIAELALVWRGARVELERGARLAFGPERFSAEGFELRSESAAAGGTGRAAITLTREEGVTRGELAFERYDAGPLLAPFLPEGRTAGRVHGRVSGRLGGAAPALALELALEGWNVDPSWPELAAQLDGSFDGSTLALERFVAGSEQAEAPHARGALRMPWDPYGPLALTPGPVEVRLELDTRDLARTLRRAGLEPGPSSTGPSRLALELGGEWRALTGTLEVAAEDVTLGTEIRARSCDLEARLAFGEGVRIESAVFSAPSGTITLEGEVRTPLDLPRWLEDRFALLEAPLELGARVDLADVGWVAGLYPDLRRISGQVAGRLTITGTAFEPELAGKLTVRDGELRLTTAATPVRSLAADLRFEGQVVHVEFLVGEVGGAPVRVQGTLEPFGPFPRIDLALEGDNLLLRRSARTRLRADTELRVKGTPSQLSIRGEVVIAEGRYTGEISPLEELLRIGQRTQPARGRTLSLWPEGRLSGAELDVRVAGTRTFEYQTNLLEASLRPDLHVRGTGAFPELEGTVYVEEAKLVLPSGTMELTSGVLNFRREAPLRPEAALTAEMRLQRHDVRATATGTLDLSSAANRTELEIVLASTPPLPQDDLWILVLTGQLPTRRWEDRSSQAMEALAVFLARDTLVRWLGSDSEDAGDLLERFEIDVGTRTSQSGQPTGRVVFYLKPRSRSSGRATYLSAELDEYDRVNYALGIVFRPR